MYKKTIEAELINLSQLIDNFVKLKSQRVKDLTVLHNRFYVCLYLNIFNTIKNTRLKDSICHLILFSYIF